MGTIHKNRLNIEGENLYSRKEGFLPQTLLIKIILLKVDLLYFK